MGKRGTLLDRSGTDPAIADVAFLTRSEHRVRALEALAERARERSELRELTGASSSTISRTLRGFEERRWIRRTEDGHEATALGAYVAEGVVAIVDRVRLGRTLGEAWQPLAAEAPGLDLSMVADATITTAEPADPYGPVKRFVSLLRETDRFRFVGFELPLLEPCRRERHERVLAGMDAAIVDPPSVVRHVASEHADAFATALESGNLEVRVHDDLPSYGIGLLDERVAIGAYDPDSGTVAVLIDTHAPEVRAWAESTYETYRRESRPPAEPPPLD